VLSGPHRAAEDAGRARISINPLENAHHRRLTGGAERIRTVGRLFLAASLSRWPWAVAQESTVKSPAVIPGGCDCDRLPGVGGPISSPAIGRIRGRRRTDSSAKSSVQLSYNSAYA